MKLRSISGDSRVELVLEVSALPEYIFRIVTPYLFYKKQNIAIRMLILQDKANPLVYAYCN